jgi:hypothetical protein
MVLIAYAKGVIKIFYPHGLNLLVTVIYHGTIIKALR